MLRTALMTILVQYIVQGTTNILQATGGDVNGGYNTNGFVDVGGQVIVPGSAGVVTNQTDWSGATNVPSRFYRVRLVP